VVAPDLGVSNTAGAARMTKPVIEPATNTSLTCGTLEFNSRSDAKARRTTYGYVAHVDGINSFDPSLQT
jgi:hypothetical protein